MDRTVDHLMIRVENLTESLDWYKNNFEYVEVRDRVEAETYTNVFLAPKNRHPEGAYLELTYNHDGRTYKVGNGWDHFAVRVDDVAESYQKLVDQGVEGVVPPRESNRGKSAHVKDCDGHKIQLMESEIGPDWELDHIAWNVTNLDEGIEWFVDKFDYEQKRLTERPKDNSSVVAPKGGQKGTISIELISPQDNQGIAIGDAWGHIAIRADKLQKRWHELIVRGVEEYRSPESCNNRFAVTKYKDGHEVFITKEHLLEDVKS